MTVSEIGSSIRRARKEHVCSCGYKIRKGEAYTRTFVIVDGVKETVKESNDHLHKHDDVRSAYDDPDCI